MLYKLKQLIDTKELGCRCLVLWNLRKWLALIKGLHYNIYYKSSHPVILSKQDTVCNIKLNLCLLTQRILNGNQQRVKTNTTITIILIIWKEQNTWNYIFPIVQLSYKIKFHCFLLFFRYFLFYNFFTGGKMSFKLEKRKLFFTSLSAIRFLSATRIYETRTTCSSVIISTKPLSGFLLYLLYKYENLIFKFQNLHFNSVLIYVIFYIEHILDF